MIHLIRRFQQPLMIFVTVIIIIAFAWLYNDTRFMDRMGADRVGMIYGKAVSQAQFLREGRKFELSQYLVPELLESLVMPTMGMTQDDAVSNFVWNTMVLRHEAERLGVAATTAELEEAIKNLPAFRTNGVYDSSKYNLFVANALAPRGLSADAIEELVHDALRLQKTKQLLGTTVAAARSELRSIFELRNAKFEATVIRWKLEDFLKDQNVSDEDVKSAYEERKTTLLTDEQRKVKFVAFTLPNVEKPLVGKERIDALIPLKTKTEEFIVAMTEQDAKFEDIAGRTGAKIEETPAFSAAEPAPAFAQEPDIVEAAFRLTKDQPNSDPVQTDKGYYILQLVEVIPAREQTLDEAKTKLAETLKNERAAEAMELKATEVRTKIEAELKAGKSFSDAVAAAGVKAEAFPPFSFSEPAFKEPDAREVMSAASELQPGELSAFQPVGMGSATGGGILVFLDKKQPVDETKFAVEKLTLTEQIARTKREAVFLEWLKLRRAEAGVQVADGRS